MIILLCPKCLICELFAEDEYWYCGNCGLKVSLDNVTRLATIEQQKMFIVHDILRECGMLDDR